MKKIKDIELSSSSFHESTFPEINNFFSSYTQSIFSKKLAEIRKNKMPNNRAPQNNQSNNEDDDYETPRSNNVLTKDFFSPRSTKMLKGYTLSEKLRIKWLRSIRDYMKLQEMQVVYNYLKTANVKVLIRELRLRKCFTLWRLKYQECKKKQMWLDFASFLVKKQRTKTLKANASKIRKTRAALAKASVNAENKNGDGPYGINQKIDEFAVKTVNDIIKPIMALKPSGKQDSSHKNHQHRNKQQSEEIIVPIKTRDVYISENEFGSDEQDKDIIISNLEKKNEELEKRLSDFELKSNEQQQHINRLTHQFMILVIILGIIVFITIFIVGKSIISNNRRIDTFVKSQTAITQELTAEVADFRIALTKMSGTNKTVVPVPSNLTHDS